MHAPTISQRAAYLRGQRDAAQRAYAQSIATIDKNLARLQEECEHPVAVRYLALNEVWRSRCADCNAELGYAQFPAAEAQCPTP